MKGKSSTTMGIAILFLIGTRAEAFIQFDQEIIVRSGQDYEAQWITTDYQGIYIIGATSVGATPVVKGLIRGWHGSGSYGITRGSVFSEFGSIASGRGPLSWLLQTRYMTQYDPVSGLAAMTPFVSYGSIPPTTISSPAGKLIALSNAISVDANGRSYSLFEVQPPSGARKVLYLIYGPGVINYKKTFSLAEGDVVLDVAPRSDGGIVFLSGSATAAYMNYIDPAGIRHGPYFVGAASEVAYSPSAGGTVFTAGVGPSGNMHFTRGSLTAPPYDSSFVPFPFASSDFVFTCSAVMENGTCWWGGSYTKPGSDKNGFITATRNNAGFDNFGTQIAGGESFDEAVRSIATTENGLSMWVGDGQCAVFDSGTGAVYAAHPAVPDPNVQFRSVAVSSGNAPYGPFVFPNTNFGVVGYNIATQKGLLVRVAMAGELRTAQASLDSYVGGTNPTIYVQLFQSAAIPLSYPVLSSSGQVAAPASVNIPADEHIASFTVSTEPVSVAQDVDITIGDTRSVVARFRLLPPAPYLFSPANQTIHGGSSTVTRLSLNGKAPAGGLPVTLSTNGAEILVAPTLVVPAGLYSRSFAIQSTPVASMVTRTVTATYAGVSKSTAITLTP